MGIAGVKIVLAESLIVAWGEPVPLSRQIVDEQAVLEAGQKYGMLLLFSASSFEMKIMEVLSGIVSDTVESVTDEGYTPLYVYAQAENVSCNLLIWCSYDVRVNVDFEVPENQESISPIIILAIVIAIIAILVYLTFEKIAETVKYIIEHPLEAAGILLPVAVIVGSLTLLVIIRSRKK